MKRIVFNLLGDLVRRDFGDDAWDDLVDAARASGAYTSLGSYEDEELHRLVAAASESLGRSPAEGFILGAADSYGEHVAVSQAACMHRGAACCVFDLAFARAVAAPGGGRADALVAA